MALTRSMTLTRGSVGASQDTKWRTFAQILAVAWLTFDFYDIIMWGYRVGKLEVPRMTSHLRDSWLTQLLGGPEQTNLRLDLTDSQWRGFREGLAQMVPAAVAFILLSHLAKTYGGRARRLEFYALFGAIFVAILHGGGAVCVYAVVLLNYVFTALCPHNILRPASWIFMLFIIFANELSGGYASWRQSLGVDRYFPRAIQPWHHHFKIALLKLLSYNLELASLPLKLRRESSARGFDFRTYVGYVLYAPLYVAGPTMRFDKFLESMNEAPGAQWSRSRRGGVVRYTLRFILLLGFFDVWNHYFPLPNAMEAVIRGRFQVGTAWAGVCFGIMSLYFLYMKFMCIWRFFRAWALLDGVEAPENMRACIANHSTIGSFWRKWHTSFNEWLLRYMFIPMGGSRKGPMRTALNSAVVFTFVALWHDLNMRMLLWGSAFAIFMVPEILATRVLRPRLLAAAEKKKNGGTALPLLTVLTIAGGALQLGILICANIVGFSVGTSSANLDLLAGWGVLRFFGTLLPLQWLCQMHRAEGLWEGFHWSLNDRVRVMLTACLVTATRWTLEWNRQPALYMHCHPKWHYIPTISALTSEGFPRWVWGSAVAALYLTIYRNRDRFSTRPFSNLTVEIVSCAVILLVSVEQHPVPHYTAVIVCLLAQFYDFRREGKPWRLMMAAGAVMGFVMTLHELFCFPYALDVFGAMEWVLFYTCLYWRSQPSPDVMAKDVHYANMLKSRYQQQPLPMAGYKKM
eukprot:UC1_evm2s740